MDAHEPVNILMVDDHPAKLLSYEAILSELGEHLIQAGSGREALDHLLKTDIAVSNSRRATGPSNQRDLPVALV